MIGKINKDSDLTLEVVILIILGIFMGMFGVLLFSIQTGALPYNQDSMYGLFLVIVSIQIITMGKTPFGDLRRSWAVIIVGICTAIFGMLACFIPGTLTEPVRIGVGIMLLVGGFTLLFQLFASKEKAMKWLEYAGILRQLVVACSLVYFLAIIAGLITLLPGIITDKQTASILILYGISFFYLAYCIQRVNRRYPGKMSESSGVE